MLKRFYNLGLRTQRHIIFLWAILLFISWILIGNQGQESRSLMLVAGATVIISLIFWAVVHLVLKITDGSGNGENMHDQS
jgi:hypothetical protein